MNNLLEELPEGQREKLNSKSFPDWEEPMLATLTDDYFDDEDWIYERKLDGVRCLVFYSGEDVTLMSRNKNNLNNTYPELAEALEDKSQEPFIADGEIVAFEVTPKLLVEAGFTEWTDDNKLCHPRFLRMHADKEPTDVHKEQ